MNNGSIWVRIDNRLVHGQVIETWIPYAQARMLVVANDALADDGLQQEIIKLAIPKGVGVVFTSVDRVVQVFSDLEINYSPSRLFFLFYCCPDACRAYNIGLHFTTVNIGNLHYGPGKLQICEHVALDEQDRECLYLLESSGVRLDFRCVPHKQANLKSDWRVVTW